ncbi:MAG: hypothetical protein K0S16_1597 [Moraxellaceae bacterium]|nr:hypothetical protein [Moraxellaceae bacterium]
MPTMLNPYRFIEFNSRANPTRIALVDEASEFNYRQLWALVKKAAAKLRAAGVRPGDLVVTSLPAGLDWIITNALFHEACLTCSNHGYAPVDPALGVKWYVSNRPAELPREQLILLGPDWFTNIGDDALEAACHDYDGSDALCRLVLTSGTTGQAKGVPLTVGQLEGRLRTIPAYWSGGRGEFNIMGLLTIGGFMTALYAAMSGSTYYAPGTSGNLQMLRKYGIRSLIGSPVQLQRLIENMHKAGVALPSVREIRSAGGVLPPALVASLRQHFRADIFNTYGSTEAGGVAFCAVNPKYESSIAGILLDGVQVEIVDDEGAPLPANTEGTLRVRTVNMARGYYRNAEASAEFFRDGWFYPGDRGLLQPNGLLRLAGRNSEVINRGGVKIDPAAVDQVLVEWPGVRDAAAFGVEDATGTLQPAVALVTDAGFELEGLRAALVKKFTPASAPRLYFFADSIPRNEMGKVMRQQLREQFAAEALKH